MNEFDWTGGGKEGLSDYGLYVKAERLNGRVPLSYEAREAKKIADATPWVLNEEAPDWDPDVEYLRKAVVRYAGSLWLARQSSTGVEPERDGDTWLQLIPGIDQSKFDELLEEADARVAQAAVQAGIAQGAATGALATKSQIDVIAGQVGAAAASVGRYDSIADGLAATTNGQSFYVPTGNYLRAYKNVAGVEQAQPAMDTYTRQGVNAVSRRPAHAIFAAAGLIGATVAIGTALVGATTLDGRKLGEDRAYTAKAIGVAEPRRVLPFAGLATATFGNGMLMTGSTIAGAQITGPTAVTRRASEPRTIFAAGGVVSGEWDRGTTLLSGRTIVGAAINSGGGGSGGANTEPETPVGGVETRAVIDPQTGRSLNQLWLRRSEGAYTKLTDGPYATSLIGISGPGAATLYRRGAVNAVKWRATPIGSAAKDRPRRLYLFLGTGQSLRLGHTDAAQEPLPAWRGNVHERAYMFDSSAVDGLDRGPRVQVVFDRNLVVADAQFSRRVPLHGAPHAGNLNHAQTSSEAMGLAFLGQHAHWQDEALFVVIGTGATGVSYFTPGSAHFQSIEKAIDAAAARVAAYNAVSANAMELHVISDAQQGEEDNVLGTSQASYVSQWTAIINGIAAKVAAVGGTYRGHIFAQCHQVPGSQLTEVGMATYGQAELVRTGIAMAVPVYPMLPGGNATHLWPLTYLPLGCSLAYAAAERINGVNPSVYVKETDAKLQPGGTSTLVTITGGTGPFNFDTTTIPNAADGNYGIRAKDNAGALAVSSVTWSGQRQFMVNHAATTLGQAPKLELGTRGTGQLPTATATRLNIRDASAWPCAATGQIVSGWLLCDTIPIT
jgi:hypothetical protein